MSIPFTQFIQPNGERKQVTFMPLDEDVEAKAVELQARGYEFHVEKLSTGEVAATIFDPNIEEDVASCLEHDGPKLPFAIMKMFREFKYV